MRNILHTKFGGVNVSGLYNGRYNLLSPYGTYGKSLYFSRRGTEKKAVLQGKNGEHPHANIRIIRIFFREDELVRHPCPEALQEQGTAAKEPERISSL